MATICSGVNLLVRIGLVLLASGDRGQLLYAMQAGQAAGTRPLVALTALAFLGVASPTCERLEVRRVENPVVTNARAPG
jgi:hypothetical protein